MFLRRNGAPPTRSDVSSMLLSHIHVKTTPKCHHCSLTIAAASLFHLHNTHQNCVCKTCERTILTLLIFHFISTNIYAHLNLWSFVSVHVLLRCDDAPALIYYFNNILKCQARHKQGGWAMKHNSQLFMAIRCQFVMAPSKVNLKFIKMHFGRIFYIWQL